MSLSPPDVQTLEERPAKKQKRLDQDQLPGTRRVAACQTCRLRKVKCDKKRPCCALCQASGVECEYLNESSEKLTLETATQSILERLDQLRSELDTVKQSTLSFSAQPYPSEEQHHQHHQHHSQEHQQNSQQHPSHSQEQQHIDPPSATTYEPSRDFLRIPPHRASADTILQWPVFENRFHANTLIGVLFRPDHNLDENGGPFDTRRPGQSPDLVTSPQGLTPPDDEQIPSLVDRFLTNVYTKNPILDVERLVKHGRRCAERGVGWDGWSCLVLLACALGSVAKPFDRSLQLVKPMTVTDVSGVTGLSGVGGEDQIETGAGQSSARLYARERQQGDSCFTLACRRLGSLKYSMLGAQCHFFAGVYLMYTLRPLQSWHYFYQASIFCQFDLRMTHGLSDSFAEVLGSPSHTGGTSTTPSLYPSGDSASRKARRLEQSLYWSCFKSECEFRVELPLPQSELCLGEYPNLFPSPPSPVSLATAPPPPASLTGSASDGGGLISPGQSMGHPTPSTTTGEALFGSTGGILGAAAAAMTDEELQLRQHAMRLCREEESWYYYLTEIALRRISNRIINTFFPSSTSSPLAYPAVFWLSNIRPLLRMAQELEAQVRSWSAHLPPAMQQYETSSIIRAPHLNFESESAGGGVSRELSWAIDNRLLEMLTWLYQPFLYYFIHQGDATTTTTGSVSGNRGPADIDSLLNPWSPSTSTQPPPPDASGPGAHQVHTSPPPVVALDADEVAVLHSLVSSGIDCCLKTIDVRARYHRHHGLWYDLRSVMSASVVLLAVVKSGRAAWIPGGEAALWGSGIRSPGGGRAEVPIGGKMGKALVQFSFWAAEAPDMMRQKQVLEGLVRDIRGY